jgi:Zn finger protein HypA/HybF involved in hydrogenase expression
MQTPSNAYIVTKTLLKKAQGFDGAECVVALSLTDITTLSHTDIAEQLYHLKSTGIVIEKNPDPRYFESRDNLDTVQISVVKTKAEKFVHNCDNLENFLKTLPKTLQGYLFDVTKELYDHREGLLTPRGLYYDQRIEIEFISDYVGCIKIDYDIKVTHSVTDGATGTYAVPRFVTVIDESALGNLEQMLEEIVADNTLVVANFLKVHEGGMRWKCDKCHHYLDTLDTSEKIDTYLDQFDEHKYKKCKKCRADNNFEISDDFELKTGTTDKASLDF